MAGFVMFCHVWRIFQVFVKLCKVIGVEELIFVDIRVSHFEQKIERRSGGMERIGGFWTGCFGDGA
jgi:hypothetical protein